MRTLGALFVTAVITLFAAQNAQAAFVKYICIVDQVGALASGLNFVRLTERKASPAFSGILRKISGPNSRVMMAIAMQAMATKVSVECLIDVSLPNGSPLNRIILRPRF